jgi:DmpG-like communication domain
VNSFGPIHHLGEVIVHSDTGDHVGFLPRQVHKAPAMKSMVRAGRFSSLMQLLLLVSAGMNLMPSRRRISKRPLADGYGIEAKNIGGERSQKACWIYSSFLLHADKAAISSASMRGDILVDIGLNAKSAAAKQDKIVEVAMMLAEKHKQKCTSVRSYFELMRSTKCCQGGRERLAELIAVRAEAES